VTGLPLRKRRLWPWILGFIALVAASLFLQARRMLRQAQPILRARVIESLSARFKTKVELDSLDVSVINGLTVSGNGLRIFGATDPNPTEPGVQPLISLQQFSFQTALLNLFRSPMHVDTVYVRGMTLNIPPKQDRQQITEIGEGGKPGKKMKMQIFVDKFSCEDTRLIINTRKPGKAPLIFQISHLNMKEIGPGQPLNFEAMLVNPKPVGDIQSTGKFGPFREDDPRVTPVSGEYSFTHADLGTLKGISGILSSTGRYRGELDKIEVDGATDTPDFRVATGGHPVALHTDFHAVVDGTDGDTHLQPVEARFLHSSITASGEVVHMQDAPGHDIELDVVIDHGFIQDLLELGVKTDPPVMNGEVEMHTKMSLKPGAGDVADRLELDGHFKIPAGKFSNQKIQDRIDSLSMRSQGMPRLAAEHEEVAVPSELDGSFRLGQGTLTFSQLQFAVPGTKADVTGQYTLDGQIFDFRGTLRLDAKLSQMTTGWKSFALKAVDPLFHKHGAGTEVPFRVTGTRSEPHFGIELGHQKEAAQGPQ
jgi:AsmA-like C-terminal region